MREGYDLDEVDDFVDRVIDALDGRGSGLSPQQVETEEFKVVRMREGYVMDDVDDWLDSAAAELRRMRKAGHMPAPEQDQSHGFPGYNTPAAAPHVYPQAAPPGAPPVTPAAPAAVPNAPASGYPGYGDAYQESAHGSTQAFDPVHDSAIQEIDPALRALDSTLGRSGTAAVPSQQSYATPPPPAPEQRDDPSQGSAATPSTGLHHLEIWTTDLDLATKSFGWLFERLGWTLFQVWDNGRSWQAPGGGPYVVVERSPDLTWVAYDRKAPGLNHLALAVPERWMVDRIVSEAPSYGWHLMFADRHPYAGGPHHYAAYMENDEGFEVEVVAP